jgi:hypothetical protein
MLRNANTKNRWPILAFGWPSCRAADGNTGFLVAVKLAVFAVLYDAITLRVVLVGTRSTIRESATSWLKDFIKAVSLIEINPTILSLNSHAKEFGWCS